MDIPAGPVRVYHAFPLREKCNTITERARRRAFLRVTRWTRRHGSKLFPSNKQYMLSNGVFAQAQDALIVVLTWQIALPQLARQLRKLRDSDEVTRKYLQNLLQQGSLKQAEAYVTLGDLQVIIPRFIGVHR